MDTLEAIILGLVQGLTEFLPVSSSGHLLIGQELLGVTFREEAQLTFGIVVHAATVLATITVFWHELKNLLAGGLKFKYNTETQYLLKIGLSMIPIMIVGLFFKNDVEAIFTQGLPLVGWMLILTAVLLTAAHLIKPRATHAVGYRDAIVIGLAQAVAVLPGLSRSGTTIATGVLAEVDRAQVAKFSFLMVLVPILGEAFLELVKGNFAPATSGISAVALVAGFAAAYISGIFACRVMINIVSRGKLYYFAIYCALMGVAVLIWG